MLCLCVTSCTPHQTYTCKYIYQSVCTHARTVPGFGTKMKLCEVNSDSSPSTDTPLMFATALTRNWYDAYVLFIFTFPARLLPLNTWKCMYIHGIYTQISYVCTLVSLNVPVLIYRSFVMLSYYHQFILYSSCMLNIYQLYAAASSSRC